MAASDTLNVRAVNDLLLDAIKARGRGAQSRLAEQLGVKPQTVSKWMAQSVAIPEQRWVDIALAIGVPPLDVIHASGVLDFFPELATRFASAGEDDLPKLWHAYVGEPKPRSVRPAQTADEMRQDIDHVTIDVLLERYSELAGRVAHLEELAGVATAAQFASAANKGAGGRVVRDHGTSRPRVGPATGE